MMGPNEFIAGTVSWWGGAGDNSIRSLFKHC